MQIVESDPSITCIEEIAFRMNFINKYEFELLINKIGKNTYAENIRKTLTFYS